GRREARGVEGGQTQGVDSPRRPAPELRIRSRGEGEEAMTTTEPRPVTAQELGYDVRPIAGHIGAEILGVDLSQPLDSASVAAIRSTLLESKVIFFRDQD